MGKTFLFPVIFCLVTVSAAAQDRQRLIDNFDLASGVKIYTPAPAPKPVAEKSAKSKNKKFVSKVKPIVMRGDTIVSAPGLQMQAGNTLGAFSTGNALIDSYITDSCARYNIDPLLVYAQMNQESSFKLKAISYKGARGLMQLMPATAVRFGVTDIFNPKQNIEAGVRYMRWLLNTFGGDVRLALAGYNAGEGAVMKYGNQIPPYRETQDYVARITARYAQIRNPNFIRSVPPIVRQQEQIAKTEKKSIAEPQVIYEPSVIAVRLPNGKVQLISQ